MAKILCYPEAGGKRPSRRAVQVRAITRRLRKLSSKLWAMNAEIAHWEAMIAPPSREEMEEILAGRRPLTPSQHLLGVLYGMRLLLQEACEVAEEPANFPREANAYFPIHFKVLRGLRSLVSRRCRPERLRASILEDAPPRSPAP
jgi:hypothetical protein